MPCITGWTWAASREAWLAAMSHWGSSAGRLQPYGRTCEPSPPFLCWTNKRGFCCLQLWILNDKQELWWLWKYQLHVIGDQASLAGPRCQKAANMHPTISSSQGLYTGSHCTLRTEKARLHTKPYFPSPQTNPLTNSLELWNCYQLHMRRGGETTFLSVYQLQQQPGVAGIKFLDSF